MAFKKIKGTTDFYPEEQYIQDEIFKKLSQTARKYGFSHVEPPVIESLELLTAKSGEEIKTQIFVTEKKGKENIGLRFEFTASLARMIVEKQKALQKPIRWFSLNKVWRYERPQAGREREFFQFNVEEYGSDSPMADAEIINLAIDALKSVGLKKEDFFVRLNNRKLLQGLLLDIITDDKLESTIRIIDKKDKITKDEFKKELKDLKLDKNQVESIADLMESRWEDLENLDMNSLAREGYNELKEIFEFAYKEYIKFDITIARGLDYYTGTVFEIFDTKRKFRALAGGGRYNNIIKTFGGDDMTATGFGMGYSTLSLLLKEKKLLPEFDNGCEYFVASVDDKSKSDAVRIASKLRKKANVIMDTTGRSLQKQIKYAKQIGAKRIVFIGPEEIKSKKAKIKDMTSGEETEKEFSKL